jgi:hypothetical protein
LTISPHIRIMTSDELEEQKKSAYARGVERGRFEERSEKAGEPMTEGALKAAAVGDANTALGLCAEGRIRTRADFDKAMTAYKMIDVCDQSLESATRLFQSDAINITIRGKDGSSVRLHNSTAINSIKKIMIEDLLEQREKQAAILRELNFAVPFRLE